jgi:serine/threonine-protein kinase
LLDEAKILASLRHPGIVEVFDCGLHESDTPYLVMELIDAESLRDRLAREGPMPARATIKLMLPVIRGVHAAHERSVIHRDIKPENILCTSGATPSVKLIDFGIARVATGGAAQFSASGTPAYMAPEQVRGEPCDRRSDVWALGVTLYELLSGAPPFDGVDVTETLSAVLVGDVAFPRRAREFDGALWRTLMTALAPSLHSDSRRPSASRPRSNDGSKAAKGPGSTPAPRGRRRSHQRASRASILRAYQPWTR